MSTTFHKLMALLEKRRCTTLVDWSARGGAYCLQEPKWRQSRRWRCFSQIPCIDDVVSWDRLAELQLGNKVPSNHKT